MDLLERAQELVAMWRPRLGIAEVINVEVVSDDDSSERELEARCIPIERDGLGLWEFTIQVGDTIEQGRLERAIIHELVHVIMESLRGVAFRAAGDRLETQVYLTEAWETCIDRIADAFLRAYVEMSLID